MPRMRERPSYLLHRPAGQARVRIDGRDFYLGVYRSQESRDRYDELIAEWLSRQDTSRVTLKVDDLVLLYMKHAEDYYRHQDGTPTGETTNLRHALRYLIATHGCTRVRDFGPRKLKDVQKAMVNAGLARTNIIGRCTGSVACSPGESRTNFVRRLYMRKFQNPS